MKHMAHKARKRFGQNFLVNPRVVAEIIQCICPQPDDQMVEIGPGLGALTVPLIQTLAHLTVIELDRDIVERLRQDYPPEKLTIHSADALKFDFFSLGDQLRIAGNLPYNISTPLLFHLARFSGSIRDMHFMLQKEVVERMVAVPSTADYGRLSVMLQYRFEMERMLTVSAESFRPAPKVDSAIVRMCPIRQPTPTLSSESAESAFSHIVTAAFSQRRKTLRNTLSGHLAGEDFSHLAIDPGLRAENLTVEEYIKIANYYAAKQPGTLSI